MANPAAGVFKTSAYKKETTYGTIAGQAGAQLMRRVQSTISLQKETYQSNEIRPDMQIADFRHGVRTVSGKLDGELSAGTWKDWFAAILRRDYTAGVSAATVALTIAGAGPTYTVTRGTGSYLTDGFKVGDIIRLTVGGLNAANISKNLIITDIGSATVITVRPLNGVAMVAEGPISGCTVTVQGKKTYMPATGHTDSSFSYEEWQSDIAQSELYTGIKPNKLSIGLQPSGMITCSIDLIGQDLMETAAKRGAVATTAQYFTSPTAVTSTGVLASVNGVAMISGVPVAVITGLSLDVAANYKGEPVVGSNTVPFQFPGRMVASGQFTALFDSATLRDAFINETEIDLIGAFTADNSATSAFVSFTMHRVKLGGATKSDGEGAIMLTCPFQVLLNTAGGTGIKTESTSFAVIDSAA